MRRAILTLGTTAAGLAALLSFKTHSTAAAVADPGASPAASMGTGMHPSPSASPMSRSTSKKMMTKPMASAKPKTSMMTGSGSGSGSGSGGGSTMTRTVTGAVETTLYGPMQVKVTLEGTKITNVAVVQETNDGQESQSIDAFSIPKLNAETLAAQSARIDSVSGATTTSQGYIGSLQSALDMA